MLASIAFSMLIWTGCAERDRVGLELTGICPHAKDLLYLAVTEIQVRCPNFGAQLYSMLETNLIWGDPSPEVYGNATLGTVGTPGVITMRADMYDIHSLEMLIADIFHEAGHALNNEPDAMNENNQLIQVQDLFGRGSVNWVSYDDDYYSGGCPL